MSNDEALTLESALTELEMRILAKVGRWAIAIMGTCVMLAVGASTQWFGVVNRVEKLETWKSERALGIDQYNDFRTALEGRLTRLESGQAEILRLLQKQSVR